MEGPSYSDPAQYIPGCIQFCQNNGYSYAGLQNGYTFLLLLLLFIFNLKKKLVIILLLLKVIDAFAATRLANMVRAQTAKQIVPATHTTRVVVH